MACFAHQIDSPPVKSPVEGRVADALTHLPLRKAHVSISSSGKVDGESLGVVTGNDGTFAFVNLNPGEYLLSAEKLGYLGYPTHGYSGDSEGPTLHLRLSAGQKLQASELKLTPAAVISGRVVDKDGDPCEHCSVGIFSYIVKNGKRQPRVVETGG